MTDITILPIVGKIVTSITKDSETDTRELLFTINDGTKYKMFHNQDCCEDVHLTDITGNLNDLLFTPIVEASERSENASGSPDVYDSGTWTFYRISTIKGTVVLRWLGESNGYYSESVEFEEAK